MSSTGEGDSLFVVKGGRDAVGMRGVHGLLATLTEQGPLAAADEGSSAVFLGFGEVVDIGAE